MLIRPFYYLFIFLLSSAYRPRRTTLQPIIAGLYLYSYLSIGSPAQAQEPLTWSPPALKNPITIEITNRSEPVLSFCTSWDGPYGCVSDEQDYVLRLPDEPLTYGLTVNGGRNIVIIGGEIVIPWQGENPDIPSRTMLKLKASTGIVHIEGLLGRGDDISEGIQIAAPDAIVQIQNVRIEGIHARDQVEFTDNHPDIIQTWGGG